MRFLESVQASRLTVSKWLTTSTYCRIYTFAQMGLSYF